MNKPWFGQPDNRERGRNLWQYALRRQVPVPVVLLFILILGFLAGIAFGLQNMALQARMVGLETGNAQARELQTLKLSNEWLKNRVAVLQEEKAALLDNAVADLSRKSRVIASILNSVGIDIQMQESQENSGGPFTRFGLENRDDLIMLTERYLDTIQNVPLGAPVPGVITSKFGRRFDPINGEAAYHQGLDIRGGMGEDVKATAGGTVTVAGYDQGNGRYILLDHGNGFRTKYAHLEKSLVQEGDVVERDQVVGLIGNSGRSTGPHLHYEIHYNDKIVNPTRFVRVAKYIDTAAPKK